MTSADDGRTIYSVREADLPKASRDEWDANRSWWTVGGRINHGHDVTAETMRERARNALRLAAECESVARAIETESDRAAAKLAWLYGREADESGHQHTDTEHIYASHGQVFYVNDDPYRESKEYLTPDEAVDRARALLAAAEAARKNT